MPATAFARAAVFAAALAAFLPALAAPLEPAARTRIVETLAARMAQHYISAETGARVAADLRTRLARREYDGKDAEQLAALLTEHVRTSSQDKHAGVQYMPFTLEPDDPPGFIYDIARADFDNWNKMTVESRRAASSKQFGFPKSERLPGNVAYIRIDSLFDPAVSQPVVNAELGAAADAAALILDLRENGGGSIDTVALLASYLFDDKPVHLQDEVWRGTGRVRPIWTQPPPSDLRFGGSKPIYILVSGATFSAAENLAYALQARKRAVIVGAPTRGGAHAVRGFVVDTHLLAAIPSIRMIDPVTGGDWEGKGVQPDVTVDPAQALETALVMVRKSLTK